MQEQATATYFPTYEGMVQCQQWDMEEYEALRWRPQEVLGTAGLLRIAELRHRIKVRASRILQHQIMAAALLSGSDPVAAWEAFEDTSNEPF